MTVLLHKGEILGLVYAHGQKGAARPTMMGSSMARPVLRSEVFIASVYNVFEMGW